MMRNIILLALPIFLSITTICQSQNSNVSFGIKAGANYSKFTPDFQVGGADYVEYERKPGFYLGGFLKIEISEDLEFQPELLFALQGTRLLIKGIEMRDPDEGSTIYDFESIINEFTLAVPLVFRYSFTGSFFVDAGPQLGYIIDRNEKIKDDPFEQSGGPEEAMEYDYDNFDLGLTVGAGYNFTEKVTLNARFFLGLLERDNNIKSSVFNLGIEYNL